MRTIGSTRVEIHDPAGLAHQYRRLTFIDEAAILEIPRQRERRALADRLRLVGHQPNAILDRLEKFDHRPVLTQDFMDFVNTEAGLCEALAYILRKTYPAMTPEQIDDHLLNLSPDEKRQIVAKCHGGFEWKRKEPPAGAAIDGAAGPQEGTDRPPVSGGAADSASANTATTG